MGGPPQRVKLVNCFISAENSVLLQSARAVITDPNNPPIEVNIRVLLDSCSKCSYISQHLRDVLRLSTVRTDQLVIKTFGSESEQLTDCDLTTIC